MKWILKITLSAFAIEKDWWLENETHFAIECREISIIIFFCRISRGYVVDESDKPNLLWRKKIMLYDRWDSRPQRQESCANTLLKQIFPQYLLSKNSSMGIAIQRERHI